MNVICLFFDKPVATTKVAELFMHLSPQIAIRTDQAVFIEIGKCKNLYSAESFFDQAHLILDRFQYAARISIGVDVTDALALARYKMLQVDNLPIEALLDFVDPFQRDEALRKGVYKMIAAFSDLGIKKIGQFKKIPVGELVAKFNQLGRFCHLRCHGSDFVSWPLWVPEEIVTETKEFPFFEFYGELSPILFELKTQVDRIFARLAARQKKTMKLQVQVKCERNSAHPNFLRTFDFDFHSPQSIAKDTLKILQERLGREFAKKPILSPIEAVSTTVLKTVHHENGQKNFFNNNEERTEQIYSIHNQLVELLGLGTTYQAVLTEDRRPEKAWIKKMDNPHETIPQQIDIESIPERPTYLLKKAVKVEITAGFLHIKGKRHRMLNWDPQVERITGGWVEDTKAEIRMTYDRNYYCAVLQNNQRVLVYETPEKEFYLHGYYG